MTLPDIQHVVFQVLVEDVPGSLRITLDPADPKALALPQRVEHQSLVLADDLLVGGTNLAGVGWQVLSEEAAEISFTDKADTSAVLFIVNDSLAMLQIIILSSSEDVVLTSTSALSTLASFKTSVSVASP